MIFKLENKLINKLIEKKDILFFLFIFLLGLFIRIPGFFFESPDMLDAYKLWFYEIRDNGGFAALENQVGDYSLLYQTLVACLTYFDLPPVFLYKIVYLFFDYLLAFAVACFVVKQKQKELFGFLFNAVFATTLFLPTIVLNSSFWGQCDVLYSFFCLIFLFSICREYFILAFCLFGIAIALKLQAVLLLPFIACYYLSTRKFSVFYAFLSFFTFLCSGGIAFLMGRNVWGVFDAYKTQTNMFLSLYKNYPSFWCLFGDNYISFNKLAIILTFTICLIGIYYVVSKCKNLSSIETYFQTNVWFLWTTLLFLPAMHERYSYLLDLLLVILCYSNPKYIKYLIVSVLLGVCTYGNYLVGDRPNLLLLLSFVNVGAYFYYTYEVCNMK